MIGPHPTTALGALLLAWALPALRLFAARLRTATAPKRLTSSTDRLRPCPREGDVDSWEPSIFSLARGCGLGRHYLLRVWILNTGGDKRIESRPLLIRPRITLLGRRGRVYRQTLAPVAGHRWRRARCLLTAHCQIPEPGEMLLKRVYRD